MKANEAPEKLYLHPTAKNNVGASWLTFPLTDNDIEYVRKDAFVEKACEFLKSYRQNTPDGFGYIAGIVNDKTIEDFKKYMEREEV